MSLCSKVLIILPRKIAKQLFKEIDKLPDKTRNQVDDLFPRTVSGFDDVMFWRKRDIRWCEVLPDIKFTEDFLKKLPPEDYCFVRIGDEGEEPEIRGKLAEINDSARVILEMDVW